MTIALVAYFSTLIWGANVAFCKPIFKDYLSKENGTTIKGFFVGLVLFCHFKLFCSFQNPIDSFYILFTGKLGQLVVVAFLFYSGFGIMEQCKNNPLYPKQIFKRRFLRVLFEFDVGVLLYLLMNYFILERVSLY